MKKSLVLLCVIFAVSTISFAFSKQITIQLISLRDRIKKIEYIDFEPPKDQVWGIDISHHQQGIDWNRISDPLPHFLFLKATEGSTHRDSKYTEYKKKALEQGIPTGAYHFFSYTSSGKDQAKNFLKYADLKQGDLPPVLDAEFTSGMPDKTKVQNELMAFIQYVEEEIGVKPIIYCECDYFDKYLKSKLNVEYTMWISDFWGEPSCDYQFWQKTDKFKHPAFKGTLDYNLFKGSKKDLESLKIN